MIRHPYDLLSDAVSRKTALWIDAASMRTKQSFKEESDINVIVKRFGLTGQLPQNAKVPMSGDFTGIGSFQDCVNKVKESEAEFMKFPAEIRARFGNDPGQMIGFVSDAKNRDEAIKLGMIPKPPEKTRDMVQAIDELAAKFPVTK